MSNNDLQKEFGNKKIPAEYLFAMPYVDNDGYKAYQDCVLNPQKYPEPEVCSKIALQACIQACSK